MSEIKNLIFKIFLILKEHGRALSARQIFRHFHRLKLYNLINNESWITICDVIRQDIKINKKNSMFVEEKQGIFGLREWKNERLHDISEKDEFDSIKDEYDWLFFEPITLLTYKKFFKIIRISIDFLIPEFSAYLKSLNVDQKRILLESKAFECRRKLKILNLDENSKKQKFFENISISSTKESFEESDIEIVLDLNSNKIYLGSDFEFYRKILKVDFKNYIILQKNSKVFEEKRKLIHSLVIKENKVVNSSKDKFSLKLKNNPLLNAKNEDSEGFSEKKAISNENILDLLSNGWHDVTYLKSKLKTNLELDERYLKTKLKYLENKNKIIKDNIKGSDFWKSV